MPANIRNRLIIIALLIVGSIISLIPRSQTIRERDENGIMRERVIERKPIKYGLDLAGGMHLVLMLDESQKASSDPAADLDATLVVMRKRIDEFGVAEPLIQKVGNDRIVVELAGVTDHERARRIVNRVANLGFHLTDKTGALTTVLPAMDRAVAALGIRDPSGGAAGGDQGGVSDLLGRGDSAPEMPLGGPILSTRLVETGFPGQYLVPEAAYPFVDSLLNLPEVQRLVPRGVILRWSVNPDERQPEYRALYALEAQVIATGAELVNAGAEVSGTTNSPLVTFELNRQGGRRFGEVTGAHLGDYLAIVLDGRVQGPPPVIQGRIDRRGQIELGGRTMVEAQDLANTLKAGALRTPIKIVDERTVGATLGEDSIHNGIIAGVTGAFLVILIMIGYYRLSGVLAVIGLGLYILFTLAALAGLEATLTLPGLAGIVLSIGIAVDANVLIFERIREELALGKSTSLAVNEGFYRAMNAIVDSNVCTILTSFILFQLGTGPVRGFAITLIIGTLASMVTAIFVTRTFFLLWLSKRDPATPLSI